MDVVYTHFFTPGNHVAWQIGGGVFPPWSVYLDDRTWWECRRTILGLYPTLGELLRKAFSDTRPHSPSPLAGEG